jgi:hypothetical protein
MLPEGDLRDLDRISADYMVRSMNPLPLGRATWRAIKDHLNIREGETITDGARDLYAEYCLIRGIKPVAAVDDGSTSEDCMPKKGLKHDAGKPVFHCIDAPALLELGKVAAYGMAKYGQGGPENWREVPDGWNRYYDAAIRHLLAARAGERVDAESGLPHYAHAAWNCLALGGLGAP